MEIRSAVLTTVSSNLYSNSNLLKAEANSQAFCATLLSYCSTMRRPMNYSNGIFQHQLCATRAVQLGSTKALAHIEKSSVFKVCSLFLSRSPSFSLIRCAAHALAQYSNASIVVHTAAATTPAAISIYIKQPWANEKRAFIEREPRNEEGDRDWVGNKNGGRRKK